MIFTHPFMKKINGTINAFKLYFNISFNQMQFYSARMIIWKCQQWNIIRFELNCVSQRVKVVLVLFILHFEFERYRLNVAK